MAQLKLFYRLIVRPLLREPVRMGLTILAVALGVAVVLAIEMAGTAAAGSFHSSMETLAGEYTLEVVAAGGIPDSVVGMLATQPLAMEISPRIEDYTAIVELRRAVPLIGLDLIGEGSHYVRSAPAQAQSNRADQSVGAFLKQLQEPTSVWVSNGLKKKTGEQIQLLFNDEVYTCTVRGVYPEVNGTESPIVMDIAGAQRALKRQGRLDRILLRLPESMNPEELQKRIAEVLPEGVEVRLKGTATAENRKMLAAFRWNLRLLSYIALVVGAFLIYNTISVSVARRRAEIGVARALGASRRNVLFAFLGESAGIGLAGALLGLPLGWLLAKGAVNLMALTVQMLYVSSRPGPITVTGSAVLLALTVGVGVAIVSALAPAREAMQVAPVDAMAQGRREYVARMHKKRDLLIAAVLALLALVLSRLPAVAGKPLFGYVAAVLLVGASAYAIPALASTVSSLTSKWMGRLVGVEGLLASRSLVASLGRTSVLVGALSTAVAMMTSVGIMVGSFRQTVVNWMNGQLPADLYLGPAGLGGVDRHPTIALELAEKIAKLPGVAAVDRLRAYELRYEGVPTTLYSVDLEGWRRYPRSDFSSGRPSEKVLAQLRGGNNIIVSEPFAYKHHVKAGDSIALSLGEWKTKFHIVDVDYDYASERGTILIDRETLLKYLPDPAPSNVAVYLRSGTDPQEVVREIREIAAGHRIVAFSNRDLRTQAIFVFDRTFAITYALETVAVLVAVMGMAGALLALVIDRRREFGLLRFLGASGKQIRKLILVEAGLLGILANVAGFVLGYFLSLVLVYVINKQSFGWTIRFHWPIAVLVTGLTVVYAATLLAGLYPAQVAVRLNPLEVIHEE